jgi:uncharacterized SAM-binding protein YcdF (DUF218 family)
VPYVIVDGPKALLGYESDMAIQYAEQRGFPATLFQALHLPAGMNSTQAEAEYVGRYLKGKGMHSILLVTSNYHTHRAAYLFRKENPGLNVTVIAAADPDFSPNSWWTYRQAQKTFLLEWMKTVASYFGI